MAKQQTPQLKGAAAATGGLLLLLTSWLGRVPNESGALSSLWIAAILLLMVGMYGLNNLQVESDLGKVGRGVMWVALVLLLVGGIGMIAGGPWGTPMAYVAGTLLLPVGLILFGLAAWLEGETPTISLLLLATGVAAGPVAFGLEFTELYPSLGWLSWGVFIGVGWLAIGIAQLLRPSSDERRHAA